MLYTNSFRERELCTQISYVLNMRHKVDYNSMAVEWMMVDDSAAAAIWSGRVLYVLD